MTDPFDVMAQDAKPTFSASASYGTPAQLLDNLKQTESSGKQYAVNPDTQAMGAYQFMPSTVAMLHQQGVKFDPFDPAQSRAAADYYISQLAAKHGGDYKAAMAEYGGFKTKDPSAYTSKVLKGIQASNDPFDVMASDTQTAPQTPQRAPITFGSAKANMIPGQPGIEPPTPPEPRKPQGTLAHLLGAADAALSVGTGALAGLAGNVYGAFQAMSPDNAGSMEGSNRAANAAADLAESLTYTPKTQIGQEDLEKISPVVASLGAIPGDQMLALGALRKPALAQASAAIRSGAQSASTLVRSVPNVQAAEATAVPGAGNVNGRMGARTQQLGTALDHGGGEGSGPLPSKVVVGVGAAQADTNPYPVLSGQETVRGQYPVVKLSKIGQDVPASEQAVRSAIAGEILGDKDRVRTGVLSGNENTLRNEYTLAAAPNPGPKEMALKGQIADEQNALSNYAKARVDASGASPTFGDGPEGDYRRGQFLNEAATGQDGIGGFIRNLKSQVYKAANEATQGQPMATPRLDALLEDNRFNSGLKIAGQSDFTSGLKGLVQSFKTEGFENAPPNSVAAAEGLRKYLNQHWTPGNARFIGQAVEALDSDVASAGGPGLFEQARAIHKAEKTLYNAPGIKTLFGDVDPNGIQTATSYEKIMGKLNAMAPDQWSHIYDLFDRASRGQVKGLDGVQLPSEIQQQAAQAAAEMRGGIARSVYKAGADKIGVWNQNSANTALNTQAIKIARSFDPNEQKAMHTLNLAGQIMPGVHSYEGGGVQSLRLADAGLLERHATKTLAGAGGFIGSYIAPGTGTVAGTMAGAKLGERVASAASIRRQVKAAAKQDAQFEANAKLGKPLRDLLK